MKTLLAVAIFGGVLLLPTTSANADSCAARASYVAAQKGGRVLAVSAFQQDGTIMCQITILVKSSDGGPARKKTVVVPK